jgi:hypothetical protein
MVAFAESGCASLPLCSHIRPQNGTLVPLTSLNDTLPSSVTPAPPNPTKTRFCRTNPFLASLRQVLRKHSPKTHQNPLNSCY